MTPSLFIRRTRIEVTDALRHSLVVREAVGWMHFARGLSTRDPVKRAISFSRAISFACSPALYAASLARIRANPGFEGASGTWRSVVEQLPRYRTLVRERPHLDRSIILKKPGSAGEKGVLLMTFEYNWARLLLGLSDDEFRWLDERYDFVLSTSWSPTDYAVLALAVSRIRGTVFVQSCNYGEIASIEKFHPRLKCLPTLPCDWINPALYEPKPFNERSTDIVMVANWGEFKRHWELFKALAQLPSSLRVVLIGQREGGRTTETIIRLARDFGARQNIQLVESIPIEEVARHQCDAKVSVIMTRREGCCVAAVESLFAGCALAMRHDAHVGPLAYINEVTGGLLRPGCIAADLAKILSKAGNLDAREWAEKNVAGSLSRLKVNDMLAKHALSSGRPWTHDIVLPQWRPHPTFSVEDDREAMKPAYEELCDRFPHVFSASLVAESWR